MVCANDGSQQGEMFYAKACKDKLSINLEKKMWTHKRLILKIWDLDKGSPREVDGISWRVPRKMGRLDHQPDVGMALLRLWLDWDSKRNVQFSTIMKLKGKKILRTYGNWWSCDVLLLRWQPLSECNSLGDTCCGGIVLTIGWYSTDPSWVKAWGFKWCILSVVYRRRDRSRKRSR
jgi:hypothetical protein